MTDKVEKSPGNTFALIVGIEKYHTAQWDIDGPASDARKFSDWLIQRGVPRDNIKIFLSPLPQNENLENIEPYSEKATGENIKAAIDHWLRKQDKASLSWVYWAGHGLMSPREGDKRWLLVEEAQYDSPKCFDFNSLPESMRSFYFPGINQQVFIVDACAKYFDFDFIDPKDNININSDRRKYGDISQVILYAARDGELAKNLESEKTGLFSKELMILLQQAAQNQWPPPMDEIADTLTAKLKQSQQGDSREYKQLPYYCEITTRSKSYRSFIPPTPLQSTDTGFLLAETILSDIEKLIPKITQSLNKIDIKEIYKGHVPSRWELVSKTAWPVFLFYRCCQHLAAAQIQGSDDLFPILKFLKGIALHSESEDKKVIDELLEHAVVKLYKDESRTKSVNDKLNAMGKEQQPAEKSKQRSFIMIRLIPDDIKSNTFRADAWLYRENKNRRLCIDEEVNREKTGNFLFKICNEAAREYIKPDELCLEFILPRKQLTEAVDQWKVKQDYGSPTAIGIRHQVLVRSLERTIHGFALLNLKERWDSFKNREEYFKVIEVLENNTDELTACWPDRDKIECGSLDVLLQDTKNIGCMLISREPIYDEIEKENIILNSALNAGIPIVLWPRNCLNIDANEVKDRFKEIVEKGKWLELPHRIWQLRRHSFKESGAFRIGDNITLIWDDPERLPPDTDYFRATRI